MTIEILMRGIAVAFAVGIGLPVLALLWLATITVAIETATWLVWRLRGYDYRWGQVVPPVKKSREHNGDR